MPTPLQSAQNWVGAVSGPGFNVEYQRWFTLNWLGSNLAQSQPYWNYVGPSGVGIGWLNGMLGWSLSQNPIGLSGNPTAATYQPYFQGIELATRAGIRCMFRFTYNGPTTDWTGSNTMYNAVATGTQAAAAFGFTHPELITFGAMEEPWDDGKGGATWAPIFAQQWSIMRTHLPVSTWTLTTSHNYWNSPQPSQYGSIWLAPDQNAIYSMEYYPQNTPVANGYTAVKNEWAGVDSEIASWQNANGGLAVLINEAGSWNSNIHGTYEPPVTDVPAIVQAMTVGAGRLRPCYWPLDDGGDASLPAINEAVAGTGFNGGNYGNASGSGGIPTSNPATATAITNAAALVQSSSYYNPPVTGGIPIVGDIIASVAGAFRVREILHPLGARAVASAGTLVPTALAGSGVVVLGQQVISTSGQVTIAGSSTSFAEIGAGVVTTAGVVSTTPSGSNLHVALTTVGTGSWIVPANYQPAGSLVELVGAGGGACNGIAYSDGGGGGAYASLANVALVVGSSIPYVIGAGGLGVLAGVTNPTGAGPGGFTCFGGNSLGTCLVGAPGGAAGAGTGVNSPGGQGTGAVGTTVFSGGLGGGNGAGGGAGGPLGIGAPGGFYGASVGSAPGGGGNGAGTGGVGSTTTSGGSGGNNATGHGAGVGGTPAALLGNPGTLGGGGGGGAAQVDNLQDASGGMGGPGVDWQGGLLGGGGGGGGGGFNHNAPNQGGDGGLYGAGGGPGGTGISRGGNGAQGAINITYVAASGGTSLSPGALGTSVTSAAGNLSGILGPQLVGWQITTSPGILGQLGGGTNVIGTVYAQNNLSDLASATFALQNLGFVWTPNGTVAVGLTAVGPPGSHATVQEWLTLPDNTGTIRYIPGF